MGGLLAGVTASETAQLGQMEEIEGCETCWVATNYVPTRLNTTTRAGKTSTSSLML